MSEPKRVNRTDRELYPDFAAELRTLEKSGPSAELVQRIIRKHEANARYNRRLYDRYKMVDLPILNREPRFGSPGEPGVLNNKTSNDFFGEIVDFKTGYFAGLAIGYSYSVTEESREETPGGEGDRAQDEAVKAAGKALTDFVTRNNMYDADMECTKLAACCGYVGRLFYNDPAGNIRVMVVPPFEAAFLYHNEMTEPVAALRYFETKDPDGETLLQAEFYTDATIYYYEGPSVEGLALVGDSPHVFGGCPLQGIPNNLEMMGDAEKVLTLGDAYDRALSDANNESEAFANAYMIFENVNIDDEEIAKGQAAGSFQFYNGAGNSPGKIYFLTKDIKDAFIEHHLDRLERNIYRFSRTPNLSDENFSQNASGVAMKFKLTGIETKCGMFEAKMRSAGMYMFELLANAWKDTGPEIDPLQCVMDFHRNAPTDLLTEGQAVQALVSAGFPKRAAFGELSFVDDPEYIMQLIEQEALDESGTHERDFEIEGDVEAPDEPDDEP